MKKIFIASALLLLIVPLLTGCKKDKDQEKDYTAIIKEKAWVGIYKSRNSNEQYYSIKFEKGGTLVFSNSVSDYPGSWEINGEQFSITLDRKINTTISKDNKFIDINNDPNSNWTLFSGELNDKFNIALANTIWKGSERSGEMTISFKTESIVEVKRSTDVVFNGIYTRIGAGIRFEGWPFFAVIMPNGMEIKGPYVGGLYPWQVAKQ